MKLIQAFLRPERIEEVLDRLGALGMNNANVTESLSMGPAAADPETSKVSVAYGRPASRSVKLEFFCPDDRVKACVSAICAAACTQRSGDGAIAVTNLQTLVQVRTGQPIGNQR